MLVNGSIAYETDTTYKRKGHGPAPDRAGSEEEKRVPFHRAGKADQGAYLVLFQLGYQWTVDDHFKYDVFLKDKAEQESEVDEYLKKMEA